MALRPRPVEVYLGGHTSNYATSHEDLNDKGAVFKVGPGRYCLPRQPTLGGQGESLVPPHTRGSVSLSRTTEFIKRRGTSTWGPGQQPGAAVYTGMCLSL